MEGEEERGGVLRVWPLPDKDMRASVCSERWTVSEGPDRNPDTRQMDV